MNTKKCTGCEKEKPITAFWKSTRKKDGLQNMCTECFKKAYHNRYHGNKLQELKEFTITSNLDFDLRNTNLWKNLIWVSSDGGYSEFLKNKHQ